MKKIVAVLAFCLLAAPVVRSGIKIVDGGGGSGVSSWTDLEDIPAGFADDVDNDTGGGTATFTDYGSNNIGLTTATKNVGIGTSAPSSKLDVVGGAHATEITAASGTVTGSSFSVGGSTFVVSGGKMGMGTTSPTAQFDLFGTTFVVDRGKVGVGTASPTRAFHVNQNQGTTGSLLAVSTGTSYLFEVGGTSVQLRVPLVFQDGTSMNSASAVSSQWTTSGSSIYYTGGRVAIGISNPSASLHISTAAGTTTKLFAVSTGTADVFAIYGASISVTVPAYFYSDIFFNGAGDAVVSGTSTVRLDAATSKWEFAPSTLSYTSSNGVKYLVARATECLTVNMSSDTTNGFNSRAEPFIACPTGETWTLTKAWGYSLPAGATVQFNIGIYTSSGAYSGNSAFTLSNASATVNGSFQTSGVVASGMANATLSAGQSWGVRTPATGHAGGGNRLILNLEYLKQ